MPQISKTIKGKLKNDSGDDFKVIVPLNSYTLQTTNQ